MTIQEKFAGLGIDNAPGQEALQKKEALDLRGEKLLGARVDFSHGDVDAHMPTPGSFDVFKEGFEEGGSQAYTPYRGRKKILDHVAASLSGFTGASIDPEENLILTPGTQGALFLAMGANIMPGDKVAIVEPDYFANRKMVEFFGGQMVPVVLEYENEGGRAGISLESLEEAFKDGVKLFLFSNPNNPVGCVYSYEEITGIAALAKKYGVTLIVDELYSRQVYPGIPYIHLCAQKEIPENLITILGPSKTESLSGFRLGAAFGTAEIIERMEKLQAIMALRCSGYNQAVFLTWFHEPEGWLEARVRAHKEIRDAVMEVIRDVPGVSAKPTEGGSYLFVTIPELDVSLHQFIRIVRELADVAVITSDNPRTEDPWAIIQDVLTGMGGPGGGREASAIAVQTMRTELPKALHPGMSAQQLGQAFGYCAGMANDAIRARAAQEPALLHMGTTLVAAAARPELAVVTNIGDSRAYLISREGIRQISKDHSLVENMVDHGELTPQQARKHPSRNLITRALGPEAAVQADTFPVQWKQGDFLLLCSDGLVNTVTDQEILFEVIHGGALEECLQRLLALSRQRGAPDNVTAILLMNI